jgi:hypothetical protein
VSFLLDSQSICCRCYKISLYHSFIIIITTIIIGKTALLEPYPYLKDSARIVYSVVNQIIPFSLWILQK